jgi:hypothetical protein
MLNTFSPLLFVVLSYGFGYSLYRLFKVDLGKTFIDVICVLAVGFAALSFFAVILDVLHLGIVWYWYLLAFVYPVFDLVRKRFCFPSFSKKEWIVVGLVLLIFFVHFGMYMKGAFAYDHLEDDDPWDHAEAVSYVALEKTYRQPAEYTFHYLEPYPPTYDSLIAVFHQWNADLNFLLKGLNVLIVSLGLLFFYALAKTLFEKESVALSAVFVLSVLPAYLSHFIWSFSLAVTLMIVALLFVFLALKDKKYVPLAVVAVGSSMISQPVVSLVVGLLIILLFLLYLVAGFFGNVEKKESHKKLAFTVFVVGALGLALSFLFWGQQIALYGVGEVLVGHDGGLTPYVKIGTDDSKYSEYTLGANSKYDISTILTSKSSDNIDQQKGFGFFAFVFASLGLLCLAHHIWRNKKIIELFVFFWFISMFAGLIGPYFGMSILVNRFWAFLSIPLALLVGIFFHKVWALKKFKVLFLLVFLSLLLWTSFYPKYVFQTSSWPAGVMWTQEDEVAGYGSLLELEERSLVFTLCSEDKRVIGFNMMAYPWRSETKDFRKGVLDMGLDDVYDFLQLHSFDYVVLDATCAKNEGVEKTNSFLQGLQIDSRFNELRSTSGFFLFSVQ